MGFLPNDRAAGLRCCHGHTGRSAKLNQINNMLAGDSRRPIFGGLLQVEPLESEAGGSDCVRAPAERTTYAPT